PSRRKSYFGSEAYFPDANRLACTPGHPGCARCPDTPCVCSLSRHTLRMLVVPTHPTYARCPDTPSVRSVSEVRFSRQKLYFGSEAYFPDANRLASGVNSESSLAHQHHFTRTL